MKTFLLLLAFLAIGRGLPNIGTVGAKFEVQANTETTITYAVPTMSFTVQTNVHTNVTLSLVTSTSAVVNGSLPKGISTLSASTALGFSLTVDAGADALTKAELTTPAITSLNTITSNGTVGFVRYDATAQAFVFVPAKYDAVTHTMKVELPTVGSYLMVNIGANVGLPSLYGTANNVYEHVKAKFMYAKGFALEILSSENATVSVTFSTSTSHSGKPSNESTSLSVYFSIEASSQSNLSATLLWQFTEEKLQAAGATAQNLRFAFYNTTSDAWEYVTGAHVDVNAMVLSQTTTHFSEWGVYDNGSEDSTPSPEENSSTACTVGISFITFAASFFLL